MAITRRSDVIIPELLTEAIRGAFAGKIALWGTGAATTLFSMPLYGPTGTRLKGGDKIKVPYFGNLGELDDVTESDALTPQALTMTGEEASVIHSGKAIEISDWAQLAANYADPYSEFASQFTEMTMRRGDRALLDAASASLPPSNIRDVSSASSPRNLDYDTMVDAKMLWGDEQNDIVLLTVHSGVYGNMMKLKDTTGRPLLIASANDGELGRFCGVPVSVSDRNTREVAPSGGPPRYKSKIVKRAALAWWANQNAIVLNDSDILAHTDLAAVHIYHVAHRYARTPGGTRPGVVEIVTNG